MIRSPEIKVGLLVVVLSAIIGALTLKVQEGPGVFGGNRHYWFLIDDASGLVNSSAVKMAGITVGIIEGIFLHDGRARVLISVDKKVNLTNSSQVELRTDGILGDRHVELIPGDPLGTAIPDGDEIKNVATSGSLQEVVKKVGSVADSLGVLAKTLRKSVQGDGDKDSPVGRIILNLERVTRDLSEISGENKGRFNEVMRKVSSITRTLDELVNDESKEGFRYAWRSAVNSINRIDNSIQNIEEVTEKINNGQGTIGRLINEDETVDKVNSAIDNVNELLGGTSDLQTSIDYHSEYFTKLEDTKSYLGFRIQPGLDRYYDIQIVDDPKGVSSETGYRTVSNGAITETNEVKTYKNKLKFTVLYAMNFYDFTIKGGMMENTGGIGFDYFWLNRSLRFSVEAFDFGDLHLKSFVRYNVYDWAYLIAGGDDLLDGKRIDTFVGAGIFITNDDLKLFASKVSF